MYGGANLLATSVAQDSSLLALRGALPSGVNYAGWKRQRPVHPAHVIGIHHPGGEEKRYAGGATFGNHNAIAGPREITRDALIVGWDDGLTEGGSSGSGLFHEGALVGVLSGGVGCVERRDSYGPFADFYPRACPWLVPGNTCVDDGNAPLFLAAGDGRRESFARIINHSAKKGELSIHPRDDSGRAFAPIALPIGAGAVVHFNSTDLEMGNPRKGIARGVGAGVGDWRLRVRADVDVEVLAYVRTNRGFVTSMHDLIPQSRHRWFGGVPVPQWNDNFLVPFFNPASNRSQESLLRLANPNDKDVNIVIRGVDDAGALSATVALTLAAGEARAITAPQLEEGDSTLQGALGDGVGKWRLLPRLLRVHPRQRRPRHLADPQVVQLARLRRQVRHDVARADPPRQLRHSHRHELVPPRQLARHPPAFVLGGQPLELMSRRLGTSLSNCPKIVLLCHPNPCS